MRLNNHIIKKKYLYIAGAAIILLFLAVNVYLKINAKSTGNIAYRALIENNMGRFSQYVHFIKNKDMNINGKSLLIYAVEKSNKEAVDILLDSGADCDIPVGDNTALLEALRGNRFDIAQCLISNGGNVNTYIFSKPYIAVLVDENNYNACEFLLNQKDINTKILVENEPLAVYLYKKDTLDNDLAKLFSDKLTYDGAFGDYIEKKYDILSLGGAYAVLTSDETVPYIIPASGDNGKQILILFDSEKFSRNVYANLSVDSSYVAFNINNDSKLEYISGIRNFEVLSADKKNKILSKISDYMKENITAILGIKNNNIFSAASLLHIKDNKKYSIDDMFLLDDEVFGLLAQYYVNITYDADKNKMSDIYYQEYYNNEEKVKAKKTICFVLRLFPLYLSKEINSVYLVRNARIKKNDISINGAFSGNNNIILAKSDNYTIMALTYIHEFSHFITKNSDRKTIAEITSKYSKYGYYENFRGNKYYGISCFDGDGVKIDYYDIYPSLLKLKPDVLRKDGFARDYATHGSWEDFAVTAESMYSFVGNDFFIDYVKEKGYNAIESKFGYVKDEFNKYSLSVGSDAFMNEDYFAKAKHYIISYKYNYSQLQP